MGNEAVTEKKHASVGLKALLLIFALVLTGTLAYLVWGHQNIQDVTENETTTIPKVTAITPSSWEKYTSEKYSFTISYPDTVIVKETVVPHDELALQKSAAKNIAGYCLYGKSHPIDCAIGVEVWTGSLQDVVETAKGAIDDSPWPLATVEYDGILAKKHVFSGEGESAALKQITYFIPHDDYIFVIGEELQYDSTDNQLASDIAATLENNNIVRSLHFINR